jgi:UPF0716 family protein affecting phage T7 exclusion
MRSMKAELEQSRDRHWLACFVFGVLAVPFLAVTVAVPGLVGKTVTVGITLVLALAAFVAGRAATQLESVLTSAAAARHPAGRESSGQ